MSLIITLSGIAAAALTLSFFITAAYAGFKPSRIVPAKGTLALIGIITLVEAALETTGTDREARRIFGLGGTNPLSLLTFPYLHFSSDHLMVNAIGLAIVGTVCERQWGTTRMAAYITAASFILGISALASGTVDRHWNMEAFGPVVGNSVVVCAMIPASAAYAIKASAHLASHKSKTVAGIPANTLLPAAAATLAVALVCIDYGRFAGTDFEIAGVAHAAAAVLGIVPVLIALGKPRRSATA